MKEEEIRGKLLLPYIDDLGFDSSEITLEKSFKIRLGKNQHEITGRSDILCKRNGKNLFIIELKNDSIPISQDDIDQGISYSRALIENIAPFTIVTNGRTTRIFDSISKEEITGKNISEHSTFWKDGFTLSIDQELQIRYEALKNFISLSNENLKIFCQNQVQDRMGPIIGSIDSPSAKFIKELYIQRKELQAEFSNFIDSDKKVFGIVGRAGVGKTNTMCSFALQSLEKDFVFFYNAAILNKSPLEHIAQDLNGFFSTRNESGLVLKRLNELGTSLNKKILLFIDAIDESVNQELPIELSEIALTVRKLDNIKIFISCKSNIWPSVLKIKGNNTHLYEELRKSNNSIKDMDNVPGYLISDFNDEELKMIIPLYRKIFGFKGELSSTLLNELRNGFFLKIFSEVYRNKQIPEKIDDKELIKTYLNKSLEKTNGGVELNLRILAKIGIVLVQHRYHEFDVYHDDGINSEKLLENLNFSIDGVLPEDLFTRNILTISNKEDSHNISFYYSKIRDYIICFHSYKLDKLSESEFYNIIGVFYENYIGQSAIEFYIKNASDTHKNAFINFKKERALSYINSYESYLEENFGNFKEKFIPKTNGKIGMILPLELISMDGYALFPLSERFSEKIIFEDLRDPFSNSYFNGGRLYQIGVDTVYGSHSGLLVADQTRVIKKNIFSQLKKIIENGDLHNYNSDILLLEQMATILYYYHKELGYEYKLEDLYTPRYELIYPINLKELFEKINRFRAHHFYKRRGVSSNLINQMVEEAIKNNIEIPSLNVTGDFPPFEELFKIVRILLKRGYNIIEKHHLPYPDISISDAKILCQQQNKNDIRDIRSSQYSSDQAKLYIEYFLKHLEKCYTDFIEYYFPTFKDRFSFFNTIPHEYFFYVKKINDIKWGWYGYRSSKCGQTELNYRESNPFENTSNEDKITSFIGFSFDNFLYSDYHSQIKTIDKLNTPKVDDFCVIRSWVYKLLKKDMRELLKENNEYI